MAAVTIPFRFYCDRGRTTFTRTHDVPATLIRPDPNAALDNPSYTHDFFNVVEPITGSYQHECRAASSPACDKCGQPRQLTMMSSMSYLHLEEPYVAVDVKAVCSTECEILLRQDIQIALGNCTRDEPDAGSEDEHGPRVRKVIDLLPCLVCGKMEGTLRCGRCVVVGYCGKGHQRAHWPVHKLVCVPMRR